MVRDPVLSEVEAALADLNADAVAIGAAVGDQIQIACRGSLAGRPVDARSVFYGASVTKQLIGVRLAGAIVDGAATTDDPIRQWLPELPDWLAPVRLRHLIHHTSGLPDVTDPALGIPAGNADIIERLRRWPPERLRPGSTYAYNNTGYVLLAEALAQILGRPIVDAVTGDVFAPLALADSRLGGWTVSIPSEPDPPGTVGDGGLWTSIADLIDWLRACNARVLGTATHELAETTSHLDDGTEVRLRLGGARGVHAVRTAGHPRGQLAELAVQDGPGA